MNLFTKERFLFNFTRKSLLKNDFTFDLFKKNLFNFIKKNFTSYLKKFMLMLSVLVCMVTH